MIFLLSGILFVNLETGGEEVALGGGMHSAFYGARSIFSNPGFLSFSNSASFSFSHREYLQGTRYDDASFIYVFPNFTLGAGMRLLYAGGFEHRIESTPEPDYLFSTLFSSFHVGGAYRFKQFSVGGSFKLLYGKIDTYTGISGALDIGIASRINKNVFGGLALKNLGLPMRFREESTPLPVRIGMGGGYENEFVRGILEFEFPDGFRIKAGLEGKIKDVLFIRGGYSSGTTGGFRFGLGVRKFGVSIDYAFVPYGPLGLTHIFTLSITPYWKKLEEERKKEIVRREIEKRSRLTAESFYTMGVEYMREGRLEESEKAFDMALIWDPDYEEARRKLEEVRSILKERKVNRIINEGIDYYKKGDYFNAIDAFSRALGLDPQNPLALKWFDATTRAMTERRREKGRVGRYIEEGMNYYKKGDYEKAISSWRKGLKIDPANKTLQSYISRAKKKIESIIDRELKRIEKLLKEGRAVDAKGIMKSLLNKFPSYVRARKNFKEIQERIRKEAVKHLTEGEKLYRAGKYGEAEIEFEFALRLDSTLTRARKYLQLVKKKKRKVDVYELYMKGINAYTKDRLEEAIAYWEKVLEIDPAFEKARKNLERAREKLEKVKKLEGK
ncbi:hypothetical protein DRQ20_03490 [bacterium]|nr:MAG: hypothetical protein DRQ20_03490 [bacterium]